MEFPYRPELVHQAGVEFDKVVARIQAREFTVKTPAERKICKECDLRSYCAAQGTITRTGRILRSCRSTTEGFGKPVQR